jgi:CHASE2 domain-containing sensor protein
MAHTSGFSKIVAPITRKGWGHWLRFALLLAMAALAGHLLKTLPSLTSLRYRLYGAQLKLRDRSALYPKRTALVLLDDNDYWGELLQSRTPVKRAVLADIIDKLRAAGVNTVALDVDLRSPRPQDPSLEFPDYLTEDGLLLDAVAAMCDNSRHVVLASSVKFGDNGYEKLPSIYTSAEKVIDKVPRRNLGCVVQGYIQLPFDMRRLPGTIDLADGGHLDSMSLAVTGIADPFAHDAAAGNTGDGFRFSEYLTEADFAAKGGRQFIFSGAQIEDMDAGWLRNQLADKLVFIGAKWHTTAYGTGPAIDQHDSPGNFEAGVMLHANYVEAMLDRTGTFAPISDEKAELLEIGLALVLAIIGVLEIHTAWKWAAFIIGIVLSALFTYSLLQNLGLFLDFAIPLLMIVVHTFIEEGIKLVHEAAHSHSREANPATALATGAKQ